MWALPLAAALIAAFFSGIVARRFFIWRIPALLSWSLSLFLFAAGSMCTFIGSYGGWSSYLAKIYYLVAALMAFEFLGLGTIYLLAPRRAARFWLTFVLATSVAAAMLLSSAGVDNTALASATEPGWEAIRQPDSLTALIVLASSATTLILAGGAAYAAVFKRYPLANILIVAGALIAAAGGSVARGSRYELASIGQILGIVLIFAGAMRIPGQSPGTGAR